ncbi:MAG: lysophospholipid acyltransferase family protein [Halioglobus sp.]
MPQYYLVPKRLAERVPALGSAAQSFEAFVFRSIFWLIRRLSLAKATALAGFFFRTTGPLGDKAKKAKTNLGIAFPDASAQWIDTTTRGIFQHLGISTSELIKLEQIWQERDQRLEFNLEDAARAHLEQKGAVVFVCAHVGAWQLTNFIAGHMGLNISTVYAPESNPALRDMMLGLRNHMGVNLIPSDAGVRPLIKELNNGNCIGMAMDTRLNTGKLISFFGKEALTNTTAARLALRTGAALIPINAVRLPGQRYRIDVYDPLVCENDSLDMDAQAEALTARINGHFEEWIKATPDQWICLKRRWPKAHKL